MVMLSNLKVRMAGLGNRLFPGMEVRQVVTLYLAVPLSIGAVLGWYRAGYASDYPLGVSLLDWLLNFVTLWIAFDLGTRLTAFLLRPWTPPLWGILVVGGVAGVAVSRPLRGVIRDMTSGLAPQAQVNIAFPPDLVWEEYVFAYASVIAVPILIWVVVNYIYAEALSVPRYGHVAKRGDGGDTAPTPETAGSVDGATKIKSLPVPEFVTKLTTGGPVEIMALQAEDHYLRVYTEGNNELIRYRFSDALEEVKDLPGLQVHRSFWVSTSAIEYIRRAGRSYEIVLAGGLEVPVSRSFRYAVKDAGLLQKFGDKPAPPMSDSQVTRTAAQ